MAIAIVVHERAPSSPPRWPIVPKASLLGGVAEGSVPVIAIKAVLSVVSTKNVVKAIIVVVGNTDATCPANGRQTGFLRDVAECAIAIVLIKPISRLRRSTFQAGTRKQKDVHPTVVVIINKGTAATVGFQN